MPEMPRRFRIFRLLMETCVGACPSPSTWCSRGCSPALRWRPPTSKWVSAPAPCACGPAGFSREGRAAEGPPGQTHGSVWGRHHTEHSVLRSPHRSSLRSHPARHAVFSRRSVTSQYLDSKLGGAYLLISPLVILQKLEEV